MPYRKKYKKSYRRSNTSKYLGYASSVAGTASKALQIAYGIKKLMNVEFKFHDVQLTSQSITGTASIHALTNIPQGDTSESRDGAQVKLTRLQIRYLIKGSATSNNTAMRVMIVHDKQTNQAIYNINDLLQDSSSNDAMVSPLNLDNKFRFRILYNKVHVFNATGRNTSFSNINKALQMRLRFDASTPSIADLTSNSLSIVFISDKEADIPTVTLFSRVRFVDN